MRRLLLNLAAAVSLVLCLAMAALWVRSYFSRDTLSIVHDRKFVFSSTPGGVQLEVWTAFQVASISSTSTPQALTAYVDKHGLFEVTKVVHGQKKPYRAMRDIKWGTNAAAPILWNKTTVGFGRLDFVVTRAVIPATYEAATAYRIPVGPVVTMFLVLPFARLVPIGLRWWRRGRVSGLCVNCGYDLCATPDRCPECGAQAEVKR